MSLAYMVKMPGNIWRPGDEPSNEALSKLAIGEVHAFEHKKVRNYQFLKKFFAMLSVGFDAWEPAQAEYRGMPAQKNRERFREDCTIAAGFYEIVADLDGKPHAKAKSIAFGNMKEAEFEQLYSAVADVLLQRVLTRYTRADLDRVVNELLAFT